MKKQFRKIKSASKLQKVLLNIIQFIFEREKYEINFMECKWLKSSI